MAQLTYPIDLAIAFPGMFADLSPRNDVFSRISEEAASFDYGLAVVDGTDPDNQALLPTSAGVALIGVSAHTHANTVGADDLNLVDPTHVFNVLHVGRIYIRVEDACVPSDTPHVRITAGVGENLGAWRTDVDGGDAVPASGCRFISSAGAGEIAILEIDADAAI